MAGMDYNRHAYPHDHWDRNVYQRVHTPVDGYLQMLPGGHDITMPELQDMAARQQQQIENQQHVLMTKEQRLKYLKQEARRQQQISSDNDRLRKLQENVKAQELKLRKLRALRGQVEQHKLNNGNLTSELESIKALFNEKEKELSVAVMKVDELTRQLEDHRQGRLNGLNKAQHLASEQEIDRLKRELAMRSKLNNQQSNKLAAEKEVILQRKDEISKMDKRIHELQQRLKKRQQLQQMARQQNDGNAMNAATTKERNASNQNSNVSQAPAVKSNNAEHGVEKTCVFDKNDTKYRTLPHSIKLTEQDVREKNNANKNVMNYNNRESHKEGANEQNGRVKTESESSVPYSGRLKPNGLMSNSNISATQPSNYAHTGFPGSNFAAKPYGSNYSPTTLQPVTSAPLPHMNIHEEPRTGGSGQSSPANSDNSSPGGTSHYENKGKTLTDPQVIPTKASDQIVTGKPPQPLNGNQYNVHPTNGLTNSPNLQHLQHPQQRQANQQLHQAPQTMQLPQNQLQHQSQAQYQKVQQLPQHQQQYLQKPHPQQPHLQQPHPQQPHPQQQYPQQPHPQQPHPQQPHPQQQYPQQPHPQQQYPQQQYSQIQQSQQQHYQTQRQYVSSNKHPQDNNVQTYSKSNQSRPHENGQIDRNRLQNHSSVPSLGLRHDQTLRSVSSSSSDNNIPNRMSHSSNTTGYPSNQQPDRYVSGRQTPSSLHTNQGKNQEYVRPYDAYSKPQHSSMNHPSPQPETRTTRENTGPSNQFNVNNYDNSKSYPIQNHIPTSTMYQAQPRASVTMFNPPQSQNNHPHPRDMEPLPRQPVSVAGANASQPSTSQQPLNGRYTPSNLTPLSGATSKPQPAPRDFISTAASAQRDPSTKIMQSHNVNTADSSQVPSIITSNSYKTPVPAPRQVTKSASTNHVSESRTTVYRNHSQSENKDGGFNGSATRQESFKAAVTKTAVDQLSVRDEKKTTDRQNGLDPGLSKVYSPMKNVPQFASKSVIANTYTQKLGLKAMEQYRKNLMLMYKDQEIVKSASNDELDKPFSESTDSINSRKSESTLKPADNPEDNLSETKAVSNVKAMSTFFNKISISKPSEGDTNEGDSASKTVFSQYASDKPSLKVVVTPKQLRRRHSDTDSIVEDEVKDGEGAESKTENENKNENEKISDLVVTDNDMVDNISMPSIEPLVIHDLASAMERKLTIDFSVKSAHGDNDKLLGPPYSTQVIKRRKPKVKDTQKRTRRVSFDPLALLLDASLEGELELVEKTAREVEDVSSPNDEGITALHNAICAGHLKVVKFLIEFAADVNSPDSDGWTPLHCAASCNNLPMVKILVENGACIFATTISDHETAAEKCEEYEDGFDGCSEYLYSIQEKLGITNSGVVYAVFDYDAQNDDEMSFTIGDKISVVKKGDETEKEWWWATSTSEGYIPRNLLGLYPRILKPEETDKSTE